MTEKLNDDRKAKILNNLPQYLFPGYLGMKIAQLEYSVAKALGNYYIFRN